MKQEFDPTSKVHVNRDDKGIARELLHVDQPYVSQARTPQLAAAEYLDKYGALLGIRAQELKSLSMPPEKDPINASVEYRLLDEKKQFDMTTVAFYQTYFGLPVWEAGVAIHMKQDPFQVVSTQSTKHAELTVKPASPKALARLKQLNEAALSRALGLSNAQEQYDLKSLKIESERLIIYQYEKAKRVTAEERTPNARTQAFVPEHPTLPLPPVPKQIQEGQHYVAAEVHFVLGSRRCRDLRWVAILEAETLSVLFLRAFVDNVNGMVFQSDPVTTNGGPGPGSTNAALNPLRTSVLLQGLNAPVAGTQSLSGSIVYLTDAEAPAVAPPTQPTGNDFNYDVRTNNFSAVNAYYNCDRFFRLVQDLGFTLASYFPGTTFPSPVDHRGSMNTTDGIEVNAHCLGNGSGGILRTTFALADTGDTTNPIGIADDWRVVLHELGGHGILYNHVNSANFGFAHSAGDSFATIINDPQTQAPDRFVSFPWENIRRHDRAVAAGWGWGGVNDVGGYSSEQILCTTHFRVYRSIGGDSTELAMRQFASRFAVYLILRAVGSLTPATNPSNASGFATALMTADLGDWTSEGQAGGAYGKVIRWAFEKQGLYQPAGAPTPVITEGAPPAVDVYIEDGRHGEYPFQPNHWSCQAIWNRRLNDAGTTHEEPVVGVTNYAYVKVKNRGTQTATGVIVKAFHCKPAAGLVYPNDWEPMTTTQLSAPDVPPNSTTEITVGPFEWIPSQVGHECMFMVASATGDPSNINNMTAGDSIPEWRLVPHDNNIGQRNVFPVAGGKGLKGLLASFERLTFMLKNPHAARARMIVNPVLPPLLAERGWTLACINAGGHAFTLNPGESRDIIMQLKPGKDFTPEEVAKAGDPFIHLEAYANGILIGGMSYQVDHTLKEPAGQKPPCELPDKCADEARALLDCLGHPVERIKKVRIRKINVDIEIDEEC
jgi:zinc metalloprotease ZmpB